MTSTKTLNKLLTLGTTAILVLGGSFIAVDPASATGLTTAPTVNISVSAIAADANIQQTGYASFSGVPGNYAGGGPTVTNWRICDISPTVTSSFDGLDMPVSWNCQDAYTNLGLFTGTSLTLSGVTALGSAGNTVSNSSLIGKYLVRFEMSKNLTNNTIYGWATSQPKLIVAAPTMTGPSGNVNGTLGSALTMSAYTTTGLTSPIIFSYTTTGNMALPAGVTFDTTTGQLTGTPTASISNLMVTVTATGNNGLTKSSTFNFTVTGGGSQNQNQNQSGGTPSAAPGTPTLANGTFTKSTPGTWVNAQNVMGMWMACSNPHGPQTNNNGHLTDCGPISATALSSQNANWLSASTFTPGANINKWVSCSGMSGCITASISAATQYFAWYEYDMMNWTQSATVGTDGSIGIDGVSSSVISQPVLTPEQAKNQIKPLPVIVQPLVAALPQLSKPMANLGGKLDLTAGNFSGLVSASISGKPLDLAVATNGGLTITVPNGEAGKTADLFLKFTTGTVIIQDAIKYVAPVVVADVPVRPVSIAAGSTKLNDATADQVRQAAFANMQNTTISCVAYAASGSAAARTAAIASAEQVCALATKANPALTATPVTVIVDKAKAKTSAVGIKVYKASN